MVFWYTPSLRYFLRFASNATPYHPAMNPEEIQLMFAARLDVFDPILGQTTDADLTRLLEELTMILLPPHLWYGEGNPQYIEPCHGGGAFQTAIYSQVPHSHQSRRLWQDNPKQRH